MFPFIFYTLSALLIGSQLYWSWLTGYDRSALFCISWLGLLGLLFSVFVSLFKKNLIFSLIAFVSCLLIWIYYFPFTIDALYFGKKPSSIHWVPLFWQNWPPITLIPECFLFLSTGVAFVYSILFLFCSAQPNQTFSSISLHKRKRMRIFLGTLFILSVISTVVIIRVSHQTKKGIIEGLMWH